MANITYAGERSVLEPACPAHWSGKKAGALMTLSGPCPKCGHQSQHQASLQVSALEGLAPGPDHLTVDFQCVCQEPHPGRSEGAHGCGRSWSAVVTSSGGDSLTVSPLPATADPEAAAAAQALRQAAPQQLADLRSAAREVDRRGASTSALRVAGFCRACHRAQDDRAAGHRLAGRHSRPGPAWPRWAFAGPGRYQGLRGRVRTGRRHAGSTTTPSRSSPGTGTSWFAAAGGGPAADRCPGRRSVAGCAAGRNRAAVVRPCCPPPRRR